ISDSRNIAPFGSISYNLFWEKTYGTLPYMFLNVAPGNEIYYYNPYAFNMMNKYEYIHDKDMGINFEHNIGNGLFRLIPLTRKLKFRQFWTAKAMWGTLSPENKLLNFVGGYPFKSLDGGTYLEFGTGIDNIFKVLRFDFIWRVLPEQTPAYNTSKFGVFGSFHLTF
ncbi:MAG: carboxypeptidase-like regulatory domain-containing protein, partial [Flavisolibacter sp.]